MTTYFSCSRHSAELNTAYTHELIDRMTIDSKGRMFHRSTAETGIAHNIFANNVNTDVPFKIQMSNLSLPMYVIMILGKLNFLTNC